MTASTLTDTNAIACPKCGGQMWDNRVGKKNPKSPDYKCKTRTCEGVIWPPKKERAVPAFLHNAEAEDNAELAGKIGTVKKPTMREAYKQLTEWVWTDIGPIYEAYFPDSFDGKVAAACVQTLFIQACQSGKVE